MKRNVQRVVLVLCFALLMQGCSGGVGAANKVPKIDSVTPSANQALQVAVSDELSFSLIATDPDGDPLHYSWSQTGPGDLLTTNESQAIWKAAQTGTASVQVVVTDGKGGTASHTWRIQISENQAQDVVGVYLAHRNNWPWGEFMAPYWMVLHNDGTVYYCLPLEGLDSFDRAKSKIEENEDWGFYQIHGNTGTFTRESYPDQSVEVDSQGNILRDDSTYRKVNSVNGLTLEGSWTFHIVTIDALDPDVYPTYKPIITFSANGTFVDQGLFKADYILIPEDYGDPGRDAAIEPGQGWYEIKNYTLFLHYEDGRVRKVGFCPYYGEQQLEYPIRLYFARTPMYRME
jgi:hypothetical protein